VSDRLLTPGPASDPWYSGLRDATDARTVEIREWCEALWARHQTYADTHFLVQIRQNFHARFWEMYLTVTLLELGHRIACPKPMGPDVGIEIDGRRVWFEAVAPKPGDGGDKVPPMALNQFQPVPNEQLVLRYLNAIDSKLTGQLPRWRAAGIVADGDALVIAINPRSLGRDVVDSAPPRILQAAFPMGSP
jgi:type I restriction enzyme S subunit